jgi:hypothetical protein
MTSLHDVELLEGLLVDGQAEAGEVVVGVTEIEVLQPILLLALVAVALGLVVYAARE